MKLNIYQILKGKKLFASVALCSAMVSGIFAQTPHNHQCGNDIIKLGEQYPDFWQAYEAFENTWNQAKNEINYSSLERSATGAYIIPVVVHVLHKGGSENISRSQINTLITSLNTFYSMEAPNLSTISGFPAFDTVVPYFNGNDTCFVSGPGSQMLTRFEFRLATKDPQGNCSDGIVRVYTEKTDDAITSNGTKFKSMSSWDRSKYLNVWSVSNIESSGGNTTLGFAQFPFAFGGQFPLTSTDGVTLIHQRIGTNGTAAGGNGATAVHEVGHWLGLFHIWGDEECGSDGIDDTPIHFGPNYSDPGCFPLPKTATCYTDTNSTDTAINQFNLMMRYQVGEMWMNCMDYTDDNCMSMFSEGQYRKMNVTMETVEFRGSLSTSTNLLGTGTDDASQSAVCGAAPIADLWSTDGSSNYIKMKLICAGADLTMRDGTFNTSNPGNPTTTRVWDFPGGTPSTSTTATQLVAYNTPGTYDVTVTSTNSVGTSTKTRNNYVHVSSNTADESNYVYYDDFEYATSLYEQGKWIVINQGINSTNQWEQATNTGYMSSKCMVMKNEDNIIYEKDFLISPSYDLTTISGEKLYFKYAGARRSAMPWSYNPDQLRVYASTNCGETWSLRPIKIDGVTRSIISGDTLYSAGMFTSGFVPTNPSQWNEGEIDLASFTSATNFRVMFEWTSGGPIANDFYIDQLMISNSTSIGIDDPSGSTEYAIYPNPVTSTSQVYFTLADDSKVKVDVLDITGRVVLNVYAGDMNAGEHYLEIHNDDFSAAGVYLVRLNVNGKISTKKIIVE